MVTALSVVLAAAAWGAVRPAGSARRPRGADARHDLLLADYTERRLSTLEGRLDKFYQDLDTVVRQYRDFEVEILTRLETMSHETQYPNHWWDGMQARLSELEKAMEDMDKRTNCDHVCRSCCTRPEDKAQPEPRRGSSNPAARQQQRPGQGGRIQDGTQGGSVSVPGLTLKISSPAKAGEFTNTTLARPAGDAQSPQSHKPRSVSGITGKKQAAAASSPALRLAYTRDSECDVALASVKSVKTVRRRGSTHGAWLKDAALDVHRLYLFDGTEGDAATVYASVKEFAGLLPAAAARVGRQREKETAAAGERLRLPSGWRGTGSAVYAGSVYYHRRGTANELLRYDLAKSAMTGRVLLRGAGRVPVYQLSPFTTIDLAVDEHGLWALHAEPADSGHNGGAPPGGDLVLSKLNASSPSGGLNVEATWRTACPSHGAQASFLVCGTLHVVYAAAHDGDAPWIACAFDPETAGQRPHTAAASSGSGDRAHLVPFPTLAVEVPPLSSLHYNRRERQLYAWADGYQALYKLGLAKKKAL